MIFETLNTSFLELDNRMKLQEFPCRTTNSVTGPPVQLYTRSLSCASTNGCVLHKQNSYF